MAVEETPPAAHHGDAKTDGDAAEMANALPEDESQMTKEQAQKKLDMLKQQITAQSAYLKEANS